MSSSSEEEVSSEDEATAPPMSRAKQKAHVARELKARGRAKTKNEEIAEQLGRPCLYGNTELPEYVPEYNKNARLIVILGKRNTGKTVTAVNLIYALRKSWSYGIVLSTTKHNNFWQRYVPQYAIVDNFDQQLLNLIVEAQKTRVQQRGTASRFLLLLDDMAATHDVIYDKLIPFLAFNGRHLDMDVVYLTQYFNKASTSFRSNCDLFMVLTQQSMVTMKKIYDEFCALDFASFEDFMACVLRNTEDWGVFCIENIDPNARGIMRYGRYAPVEVEKLPAFHLFCPAAWHANQQNVTDVVARQREEYQQRPKYAGSTMAKYRLAEQTKMEAKQLSGQTMEMQRHRPRNPMQVLLGNYAPR